MIKLSRTLAFVSCIMVSMSLSGDPNSSNNPLPRDAAALRASRRRARRRSFIPTDAEGQRSLIASLSRRAYPSFELFIFSLACGVILGLGFLLDSHAMLLMGILVAPSMIPWVGFLLAILTGSVRFLFETLMALLVSMALVFAGGLLPGFAARLFLPMTLTNVFVHARLWLPALGVLAIGAVTLVASFARTEEKPFLPSVLIAYTFYLPVSASGFGLGSGLEGVWPHGLLVFVVHFSLASFLGLVTLFILKLRPSSNGLFLSGFTLVVFAVLLFGLMRSVFPEKQVEIPLSIPPTMSLSNPPLPTAGLIQKTTDPPRPVSTSTPRILSVVSPTGTVTPKEDLTASPVPLTRVITFPASETPTVTLTIPADPVYVKIAATEGGGANLRQSPGGTFIMTLLNGTIVETDTEFRELDGVTWIHVFVTVNGQQVEGWLLESIVAFATPAPVPTSTP